MTKERKAKIRKNRKAWARELRSGKWKQCRNVLHNGVGYCCLGVAAAAVCKVPVLNTGEKGLIGAAYDVVRIEMGLAGYDEFVDANDVKKMRFKTIAKMVDALPDPV